jgi:cytochrome b subunit of formate dehydrogenase
MKNLFLTFMIISMLTSVVFSQAREEQKAGRRPTTGVCPPFYLRDEAGNVIDPIHNTNANKPYSPKQTCGASGCHDYEKITEGYHFTQGAGEQPTAAQAERIQWVSTPGNYGGSWCSPAPLYRYLSPKQNTSPQTMDMTSFSFITAGCGNCHPGGGSAEYDRDGNRYDQFMKKKGYVSGGENDFDGDYYQARWTETGVLEADCMICHQPEYKFSERNKQLADLNFRWAPTAAAGWANVSGSIQKNTAVEVVYNKSLFDAEGKVSPHIVREPRNDACLACHAQPGWKKRGANFSVRTDVHLRAGLKCVDCHPAGSKAMDVRVNEREMHQIAKGDDPGGLARNDLDNTVLDCDYCHSTGHLGAPVAKHAGLPPVHLDRIACQTCHIPQRLVKPAQFQASDVFNPGTKIPSKGKHLWTFYGPDMQYYNHYGNMNMMGFDDKPTDPFKPVLALYKGKIYPVNRVHTAWPAIEIAGKPGLTQPRMGDIYKMWSAHLKNPDKYPELSKVTDDNEDGVIEVNRAEEIDALIAAVTALLTEISYPMDGKRVVWAMDDRVYTSGAEYRTIPKEDWEASVYGNVHKYNHDVYPAKTALGSNGCDDCHTADSDFFFAQVLQYPFDDEAKPVTQSQFKIMGYNSGHNIYSSAAATTAAFFRWLTLIVLAGLFIHIVSDFIARRRMPRENAVLPDKEENTHQRFNIHYLSQHLLLIMSVLLLVISAVFLWGLRYPGARWAASLASALGGVDFWRIIHRGGALLLIFTCFYHFIYSLVHPEGRRDFVLMLPRRQDLRDLGRNTLWFTGLRKDRPRFGRFTYFEKFDYWAVFWGCAIMIVSGLVMWFPEIVRQLIPSASPAFFESFKEAHAHEAALAVLVIFIWHIYNVHLRPDRFPGTLFWMHGQINRQELVNEHPLEMSHLSSTKVESGEVS